MIGLTIEKILFLTLFFIPGYVYLKSYRLFIADTKTDFSKDLYEAIGISIINLIIFSYPIFLITTSNFFEKNTILYFIIFIFIILIAPMSGAFIYSIISKKDWFQKFMISPTKSSWDIFFSKRESYWVIITLKNGTKIGGKYGLNSFSSTFPSPKDIYIQEVWKINKKNEFKYKINKTEGILITENEISTIEFFL